MTTQGKFTLSGVGAYLEELNRLGHDIDVVAQEVVLEAGQQIQADMQNLVPVDTGNLYDHIQINGPHRDGNFHFVEVGVIHDISFTDAETAIYGNVIEYGSSRVNAQPYIRPALKKNKSIMRKTLKNLFERMGIST
jgi:HK97 gp10 family phage protein